ncbi:MAG: PHP domain-containing protein, partial [Phycisphaerales bacterium]|nr:PHP domain-containing protein [Phycisphaerales bacterium]
MPEHPDPKPRPHPWTTPPNDRPDPGRAARTRPDSPAGPRTASLGPSDGIPPRPSPGGTPYAELHVTSNFTFLTGASHPEELVETAAALGHHAVAVTDVNSLAGIVRAHVAAKDAGLSLVVGARLVFVTDPPDAAPCSVLVYPTDRASYARLCTLLTLGRRRAPKGSCHLDVHDLLAHHEGLLAVVIPPEVLPVDDRFIDLLRGLRAT